MNSTGFDVTLRLTAGKYSVEISKNQDNLQIQQANSNVVTANVSNQIPSTSKRNIIVRAFKYLTDRIVAALKFVCSKIFPSKPEASKDIELSVASNGIELPVADSSRRSSCSTLVTEQDGDLGNKDTQNTENSTSSESSDQTVIQNNKNDNPESVMINDNTLATDNPQRNFSYRRQAHGLVKWGLKFIVNGF